MQQHLEAALEINLKMGGANTGEEEWYAMLADAAAQGRDPAALRKYIPLAEETAAGLGHKLFMAITDRASAVAHTLAGEYPQAEAKLQRALELFTSYPAPWQTGRTLFEMGELASAQTKIEQARDYFSQALHLFEELHAAPYAARTRAALENLNFGSPWMP
jgi:tetratricopeptide (TPR) repeat protein